MWLLGIALAAAQAVSTTTVQGTVYLANGQPGSGTLVVSWPAFTTAAGQVIAADQATVAIAPDGFVNVNLAANIGATPAGEYYTAVFYMSDGSTSTQYWVVPAAAQANLAQVQAQVMPAAQAVQAVSKAYVDQSISEISQSQLTASGGTLSGPLYLNSDPTQASQAADKHYVDAQVATAVPLSGGTLSGPLSAMQIGALYQADQFPGADLGAKIQACVNALNSLYGGTCDARNFTGNQSMGSNLTISTGNTAILLPCATISTANQIAVTAGTRNVALRGCAMRGGTAASGSQGGTVFAYSGTSAMVQVGDPTYAADTPGFHMDDVVINTTGAANAAAQGLVAYRTQELDLESLYLLGNSNQTGMTLDGTGNYTGGTFLDDEFGGYATAINAVGHQVANPATTDWMNASAFIRLHIDCPTSNGSPISGTYGINLQQGDGNTFTGGDVEGCATALHLGPNAQNNTIVGLRNENSTNQAVADAGSSYNNWIAGGTMFNGKLADSGTRNSFLDTFHRSFNGLNGDWYGSQQDATVTNHYRLGTGAGSERGLLNRYQTDSGYRWTTGLSDATAGEQFYQILDELNNVYRLSIGQYNNGQSSTNNQTVINSAGMGAVVLNGANNAGTGGVIFGSGGASEATVGTISNAGNAQFNGSLQVGGTSQSTGTMTVRNNTDAEVDYYLWPGLTASQKGSFTYKDWNGNSQWYMVKDASNNWALNSATGGLDSFKAYQSANSGDTYVNSSNSTGHIRLNYENGSGTETDIYSGSSANLDAAFQGPTNIKFPGLAASSGHSCLQVDASGYLTNTGVACGTGSGSNGTINSGNSGQIAYYTASGTSIGGMSAVPLNAGGTGASSASGALENLGALSTAATTPQTIAGPLTGPSVTASVNSQINVMAPPYNAKGDCSSDDQAAINSALRAADAFAVGSSGPATVYFPKPPGGCYLTSTLTWYGEPLLGQGPGVTGAVGYGGVILRGKPGQDILNPGDPTTNNFTFYYPPSIENIIFKVDDSGTPNFPHRWPGRWVDDGSMTASSAVFISPRALIDCSDVGQAIQVNGAGPGGTNLVTTIASVSPCWVNSETSSGWQTITLAVAASTTVTNAHTYISIGGLPVTATIGNCAIAFDDRDANTADWVNPSASTSLYESNFRNVTLTSTSGAVRGQNNSCGLYTQGAWQLYAADAEFMYIGRLDFGVVQASAELNSYDGSFGDYEKWHDIQFDGATFPWISYDESFTDIAGWQITASNGPQILGVRTAPESEPLDWNISVPEFEGGDGNTGFRLTGISHVIKNTSLAAQSGQNVFLETRALTGENVGLASGTTYVDGDHNHIVVSASGSTGRTVVDRGRGNSITGTSQANWVNLIPTSQPNAVLPTKGTGVSGEQTSDFIQSGNASTPWMSNDALWLWPQDALVNSFGGVVAYSAYVIPDISATSGNDFVFSPGQSFANFSQFVPMSSGGEGVIGTSVPAVNSTIYFQAKCPSGTASDFTAALYNQSGLVTYQSLNFSCTTSFAVYSLPFNFSSYSGDWVVFSNSGGAATYDASWIAIRPFQHDYNGQQPVLSATSIGTTGGGTAVPTGPASSASGDVTEFTGTSGQIADSGIGLSALTAKAATGTCAGGQYETGDTTSGPACAPVQYAQVSGTPTIPTALPPNGSASGDLSGSYPSPGVAKVNGGGVPVSAPVIGTNGSGQLVSMPVPTLTSAASTTSTSLTSTGLVLPSVPASTTVHGTCAIIWEGSSTSYATTFGLGANNAPTDLWVIGTMHGGSNGATSADKYTTITNTTATAVTTAGTPGAASTGYRAEIDFTLVTGSNPVTLTLYYQSSSSSGTSYAEPGSACWLM